MYFWRDNHKREVDIIIDTGEKRLALEVKAGETLQERFFKNLRYWNELSGGSAKDSYLVYGGEQSVEYHGMGVIAWNNILDRIVRPFL